ncbi:unnamed protein product [Gordionus sp. m RMFG-2023]
MSVRLKNLDPSSLIVISENPNTRILDPPTSFIINMSSLKICDKLSSHSLQHYNDSTSLVSSHCSPNNLMHFEAARFAERWFKIINSRYKCFNPILFVLYSFSYACLKLRFLYSELI